MCKKSSICCLVERKIRIERKIGRKDDIEIEETIFLTKWSGKGSNTMLGEKKVRRKDGIKT